MKLAHLILAHNNPLQLERLVNRLLNQDADVYIHLDNKANIADFNIIKNLDGVFFIKKRVNVVWGEYSTIQATLNGMGEIVKSRIAYSHINLLSGQDYPLHSAATTQRFLLSNIGKSFMWYDKIFDDWIHGQARIQRYSLGDYRFPGRYQLANVINKILPNRKMPANLVAYGRSQWMTITPEAAVFCINYIKKHPAVERFFRMTWAVDEVFFQTILGNSYLHDTIINDNLRYIKLMPDFRPHVFTMADAQVLTSSGKFYARKFDMNIDTAIFDYLDTIADKE